MKAYKRDPAKVPAAVVLLTRGPLVLAITCKGSISSLQLPGGKEEAEDGPGVLGDLSLVYTARRELHEETGVLAATVNMTPLVDYVAHTGRFVRAFRVRPQAGREWPTVFKPTDAGWPGWVHPGALLTRWCTYREECATILRAAVKIDDDLAMVLLPEHLSGAL